MGPTAWSKRRVVALVRVRVSDLPCRGRGLELFAQRTTQPTLLRLENLRTTFCARSWGDLLFGRQRSPYVCVCRSIAANHVRIRVILTHGIVCRLKTEHASDNLVIAVFFEHGGSRCTYRRMPRRNQGGMP